MSSAPMLDDPAGVVVMKRLKKGVTDHFQTRLSEWASATSLVLWGTLLILPMNTFAVSPVYSSMTETMSEDQWAYLCLAVGWTRFFALLINGTFRSFKFSPHIRAITSFLSIFVWAQLLWSMLGSGTISGFLCVYPVYIGVDIFNTIYSGVEAAKVDHKRGKNGRRSDPQP